MTVVTLDLTGEVFLFAQAMDNSGDVEYWVVREGGRYANKLPASDLRLRQVRRHIDSVFAACPPLPLGTTRLQCRLDTSGVAVVNIISELADKSGRVSPVLALLDVLGEQRFATVAALGVIPSVTERPISAQALRELSRLQRILRLPRPILKIIATILAAWSKR